MNEISVHPVYVSRQINIPQWRYDERKGIPHSQVGATGSGQMSDPS